MAGSRAALDLHRLGRGGRCWLGDAFDYQLNAHRALGQQRPHRFRRQVNHFARLVVLLIRRAAAEIAQESD